MLDRLYSNTEAMVQGESCMQQPVATAMHIWQTPLHML